MQSSPSGRVNPAHLRVGTIAAPLREHVAVVLGGGQFARKAESRG